MYAISELCGLLCNNCKEQCVGIQISPIYKAEHNFVMINMEGTLKLLHGSYREKEFLNFAKGVIPAECSYTDFLQNIGYSEEFLLAYRKKFYNDIYLTDDTKVLLSKVQGIDFKFPQTCYGGRDGFSLNFWMPGLDKEFHVWCCHCDDYYAPITDLANALLDAVSVDREYRFRVSRRT